MKVSVALCTYNGEKFINEQINSILKQSKKVDEIIICDDCSTDQTMSILKEYKLKHPNIFKIFKNETNLRSVKNFEKAIQLCSGDLIFLSDQDDIWSPNKVHDYILFFKNNPEINVIASNGYCIDENSKSHEKYAIWDVPHFLENKGIEFNFHRLISLSGNIATGASMAFKKEIIPDIIPFPTIQNFHHDEWIAIVSSSKNQFAFLHNKYFYYRIHSNQQVGGVFYKKNKSQKRMLIDLFDINNPASNFTGYKRRIKKIISNFERNNLLEQSNPKYSFLFEKNKKELINLYHYNKTLMRKKFPLRFFLLKISDKLLNKRKFNY
ncbi:glycosyltransferase family 2 protein [Flavobacterium columnare]|uniref:Glycosyltransferase family 2 protein n=1 Tax=Flavobacterium columnare TaxID=996 RepID=A0AAI8GAI8_9FLAO|nr:glycosyltransferase family 2 protein [Flavobacterium columnare]AMO19478.1 glycosyltransferase family 2 protein [Flavobacterium columnare]MEB3800224.1 glycosyltransferase family 2 protein [Flavobacterium columnare]QOG56446.1 glycosyltransferase family 2 protein [Flavobacterium columnare]QOG59171.1 glycosyltransferase family 2 protein [Flavobacterium columnare]QOG61891.1 glycosyltransferase family 2 protein [Flavobacterium columnare]